MNSYNLTILIIFSLFFGTPANETKCRVPKEIFNHWTHSHEEDTQGVMIFRPSSYKFPLSRGREGFEIEPNGEFVAYKIAPTDGIDKFTGKWKAKKKDIIIVSLDNNNIKPYQIKIISVTNEVLKIK